MANLIEEILNDLKREALGHLSGAGTELRKELETRLATIDQLMKDGRVTDARLSVGGFGDVVNKTVDGLRPRFDGHLLELTGEKLKSGLLGKIQGVLVKVATPLLGGQAVVLGSILTAVIRSLFQPDYVRVNLATYVTPENQQLMGQVLATATIVENFHKSNFKSVEKMGAFYASTRVKRDAFLVKLLSSELLTDDTKKAIFQFQRQWHVITPGQRNLLQQVVDKLGVAASGGHADLGDADAASGAFDGVFDDPATSETLTSSASLAKRFGESLFKGVVAKYPKVWNSWFPKDFGAAIHLGEELTDLLPANQRTQFAGAVGNERN